MKIESLFEGWDDDEDDYRLDPADRWLKRYTDQGLDRWPSDSAIKLLLKKYPLAQDTVVYRGMNFRTKEEYDEFMAEFSDGTYDVVGISSWSSHESTAREFAYVRKTYYPDEDTLSQEKLARENREHLRGYRGVLLKASAKAGEAIDIRRSPYSIEDEVLLVTGSYPATIEIVRTYAEQIADGEIDINAHILTLKERTELREDKLLSHILHFHPEKISQEARDHMLAIEAEGQGDKVQIETIHTYDPDDDFFNFETEAFYELFPGGKMGFYYRGKIFQNPEFYGAKNIPVIKGWARTAYSKMMDMMAQNPDAFIRVNGARELAQAAGQEAQYLAYTKARLGEVYHKIQEKGYEHRRDPNIAAWTTKAFDEWKKQFEHFN